jgi:preprotein translocase subunit SecB
MTVDYEDSPPPEGLDDILMATGASIAFPYCRELISNLTGRGRFGAIWLNPTNFNKTKPSRKKAKARDR